MADIFISWGSPDKETVEALVSRIKDVGLDYFEYTDEMRSGPIAEQVLENIHRSKLALFLISDDTVIRDWFHHELDWCYADQRDPERPMKALMIAGVGALNVKNIPDLIRNQYIYDLHSSAIFEKNFNRMLKDVQETLGRQQPLIIPASVFAITSQESAALSHIEDELNRVTALYREAGIKSEEDWRGKFVSRYGKTPEAFAPFSDESTIKDLVQSVLRKVNQGRQQAKKIAIQWYDRRLLTANTADADDARREWRRDCHVLFIDAVSLLLNTIAVDLSSVLSLTRNEMRRAVVWIPPYTRHASHLNDLITQIEKPMPLRSLLDDWRTRPECCLSFDSATNISMRRWLAYVLRDLSAPPPPLQSNLSELERNIGKVGITPDAMHAFVGARYGS